MVDNIIYYFSGTGNSLDIARHIAENLQDTILISMTENPYESKERSTKRVGFVCPVYYGGLPKLVIEFIKHIRMTENIYIFTIVTCNSSNGNAIWQVSDILGNTDYHLTYGNEVKVIDNNIILYEKLHDVNKKIANSYVQLRSIIKDILDYKVKQPNLMNPFTLLRYRVKMQQIHIIDYNYNVSNACDHCGICKQICPSSNIDLIDRKPVFLHRCESCMSCIQYCPKQAINYKKQTQRKHRYHHPNIEISDIKTTK